MLVSILGLTAARQRSSWWIAFVFAFVALAMAGCGGRSDPDFGFDDFAPLDAAALDEGASNGGDGSSASNDASNGDASLDGGAPDGGGTLGDASATGPDGSSVSDASSNRDADAAGLDARVPDAARDSGLLDAGADSRPPIMLVSIAVTPPSATLVVGSNASLQVTGTYSDDTTADLTASAMFSTTSMSVKLARNVVTATSPGSAIITAIASGHTATATIQVTSASVTSIALTPARATIEVGGGTQTFAVTGTLSDGTHQDLTSSVTWTSSSPSVAPAPTLGVTSGLAAGTTTIGAAFGALSASATLVVTASPIVSIAVTPPLQSAGVNVTIPFKATATFRDGSIADVTTTATWSSSNPTAATIDAATGLATTLSPGTSIVAAAIGTISGTATLTVTRATLLSIAVAPQASTLAVGGTQSFTATGTYSDRTTIDLTLSVTWSSNLPGVVFVSNAAGSVGQATAISAGSATVTATLGAVSGNASVTVTPATIRSIAITPANPSIPLSTSIAFVARGTFSDGSIVDVTTAGTWTVDDPTIASISNASGTNGQSQGLLAGSTTVRITFNGVSASTGLTVTPATLVSIAVTPANSTVVAGLKQSMIATGTFSDGSTSDLTATAVWTTGTNTIATVSNVAGAQGQLTAIGQGTTSVTATLDTIAGSTNVTVTAPALNQLVVAPIAGTVQAGRNLQFTATAISSNGTQRNVTGQATWSSSNTAAATINRTGNATGVAAGTTTITATFNGLSGQATLTVNQAVIVSISVSPVTATLPAGSTTAFIATAIFSDGSTQDVTRQATWISTVPAVAGVTTRGINRGTATAVAAGGTLIQATFNGVTGSAMLTVTNAVVTSIAIAPANTTLPVGTVQQFTATAIFSDGTMRDVTALATWVSSGPSVAGITTNGAARGRATALSAGTTTIQATWSGVTGSTTLTVTGANLLKIQVTPFTPTLHAGFTAQFQATGIYDDNTTRDLTTVATWTSNATAVAQVSDATATKGEVTPIAAGPVAISASFQGITGTASVTVSAAALASITIDPVTAMLGAGNQLQFTATGTFADGSTLDVTTFVTWISNDVAVADVSNAVGSQGEATAFSSGTALITAVRGSVSNTAKLAVP